MTATLQEVIAGLRAGQAFRRSIPDGLETVRPADAGYFLHSVESVGTGGAATLAIEVLIHNPRWTEKKGWEPTD